MKSYLSSKWLQLLVIIVLLRDGFQLKDSADSNATRDIGAVYSCTIPANLTFCNITYPVPEAVATLARVQDSLAENEYNEHSRELESDECFAELRVRLCAEHFPKCYLEEGVVNVEVSDECLPSCQADGPIGCDIFEFAANSSLGDCQLVSEYASKYDYDFTVCGDNARQRSVTEWMFHYLRRVDQELEAARAFLTSQACLTEFFAFKCEEIGSCWKQGTRIELGTNMEDCNKLNSPACFNSQQLKLFVSGQLACDGYSDVESLTTNDPTTAISSAPLTAMPSAPTTTTTNMTARPTCSIPATKNVVRLARSNASPATHSCLLMLSPLLMLCAVIKRLLL